MHRDISSESVAPWMNEGGSSQPSDDTDGGGGGSDEKTSEGGYMHAVKLVKTKDDMHKFHKSSAHADLVGFVTALNVAVTGKRITEACFVSPAVSAIVDVLKTLEVPGPSRRLAGLCDDAQLSVCVLPSSPSLPSWAWIRSCGSALRPRLPAGLDCRYPACAEPDALRQHLLPRLVRAHFTMSDRAAGCRPAGPLRPLSPPSPRS